jgi:26S proteasome regulatory subunit, ATPase 3, interacting protein
LDKKLAVIRSGAGPRISATDVANVEKGLATMVAEWSRRRRMFNNIWAAVSENIEGKQADLFEQMGVDTDEMVGEVLSNYQTLLPQNKKARR